MFEVQHEQSLWDCIVLKYDSLNDSAFVHYEGFSRSFDEWVSCDSIRLRSRVGTFRDCAKLTHRAMAVVFQKHPDRNVSRHVEDKVWIIPLCFVLFLLLFSLDRFLYRFGSHFSSRFPGFFLVSDFPLLSFPFHLGSKFDNPYFPSMLTP